MFGCVRKNAKKWICFHYGGHERSAFVKVVMKIISVFLSNERGNNDDDDCCVGIQTSKFNHSCRANAVNNIDDAGDLEVIATSDIKQGEEIIFHETTK